MNTEPAAARQFDPALWSEASGPLHLYIHLPFCPRKCRFCFYYTVRTYTDRGCLNYVDRVVDELRAYAAAGAFAHTSIRSLYLGGGTPTVAGEDALRRLLTGIHDTAPMEDDAEVTVEAFPEPILEDVLPALCDAGVTRLSLGVQTLDTDVITLNRRAQEPEEPLRLLHFTKSLGFDNVNIDLMYGIPGQSLGSLQETLDGCLAEKPAHVTAYRCVIAPATPIFRLGGIDGVPLPAKATKDLFGQYCSEVLRENGYSRYAIDHFARDERYWSRHEIGVWSGENFLGLGASGLSQVAGRVFRNKRSIRKYLDTANAFPLAEFYVLNQRDRMRRWLLLELTKLLRADAVAFHRHFDARLDDEFGKELDQLARLGWLTHASDGVSRLTEAGAENIQALSVMLAGFSDPAYEQMVTGTTTTAPARRA
jgi:oxygen-independent coproporphyrinogen III oxidase